MVLIEHTLSRARRGTLLDISRSSSYYQPQPAPEPDQILLRLIDKIHLEKPYPGSRRIVDALAEQERKANRKRVQRLMRLMGIQAIHPDPQTSKPYFRAFR